MKEYKSFLLSSEARVAQRLRCMTERAQTSKGNYPLLRALRPDIQWIILLTGIMASQWRCIDIKPG